MPAYVRFENISTPRTARVIAPAESARGPLKRPSSFIMPIFYKDLAFQIVPHLKNGSSFNQKVYERIWQKSSSNSPACMQTGRNTKLRSNTVGGGWHWIG